MKKLVCSVFFAVLMQGAARAQHVEVSVFGGYPRFSHPLLGSLSDTPVDTDTTLKRADYVYGVRATLNTKSYYGHELEYSLQHLAFRTNYTTTDTDGNTVSTMLQDKVKLQKLAYNFLVYFMPRGERWRPFATGGAQVYKYGAPHFSAWPGGGSRNYGFNFGGGLKLKLVQHTLLRLDVREYLGGHPYGQLSFSGDNVVGGRTHMLEGTVGFGVTF